MSNGGTPREWAMDQRDGWKCEKGKCESADRDPGGGNEGDREGNHSNHHCRSRRAPAPREAFRSARFAREGASGSRSAEDKALILVDTSAWIDFFHGIEPAAGVVDELLESNLAVLCGPIITEIGRGLRPMDRLKVLPLLSSCGILSQPATLWEDAGDIGTLTRIQGKAVGTVDLLIATYGLAHQVEILATEGTFRHIQRAGIRLLLQEI